MPSLRKRVSSYFRQLSFHNEQRRRHNINENSFVTKYLQGHITITDGPPIIYGKNPTDLPNYDLGVYNNGSDTVVGCYTGPNGGLTTVKRIEKHLSVMDEDIDYIDTHDDETDIQPTLPKKSPNQISPGQPIDNTTMVIKVAGNEYCVINRPKRHSKSHSLGSIKDFNIEIEKTKIDKSFYSNTVSQPSERKNNLVENNETDRKKNEEVDNKKDAPKDTTQKKISKENVSSVKRDPRQTEKRNENYNLSKSKSEGNPFRHQKRGKVIQIERPNTRGDENVTNNSRLQNDDLLLPKEWRRKSEYAYGLSDSLYDRNQVTKNKNGNPIADCFGIIARKDSAILAVADGVNWGEKASIAAKSAVHGSLHYLNKTIFNDTKPFENLTIKTDESSLSSAVLDEKVNLVSSTREVFVCLLRAFNCAHDLILENKGMLTTLTVAVVLPLKQKLERRVRTPNGEKIETEIQYVCCVCNVGDTLAYIYSRKYGIRELTKGSHDINCNRDMRDALGALGPVDGINPELSNLTLSVTTLQQGDIVMVASDGLTDNFDPNVCKFAVNIKSDQQNVRTKQKTEQPEEPKEIKQSLKKPVRQMEPVGQKPPMKPPRKSKTTYVSSRNSMDRSTVISNCLPDKSSVKNSPIQDKNASIVKHSDISHSNQPKKDDNSSKDINTEIKNDSPKENSINDSMNSESEYNNPLIAAFMSQNSLDGTPKSEKSYKQSAVAENKASSLRRQAASQTRQDIVGSNLKQSKSPHATPSNREKKSAGEKCSTTSGRVEAGYKFLRSKTAIDIRSSNAKPIVRNEDGIPYITPNQRYDLQLLLMEDILKNGLSGKDGPCTSAKQLCENLISYTISITSAKRHTLEDQDLYFDDKNGVLVEITNQEKKLRRKKGLEKVQNLPGKLDHVTVVAYNVGIVQ
ncbi:PP2C-like domain-containing protein CG9801 isoform X1 [Diorhabda sublineata]|uniref:PP2C-like domain-containing protein CG9801 isoform X1 n=1 Tax=Diorhabda sublineata TaxID=1163346 RepID=UPI0024E086D6|nr:PP2C-like domain-containing protein CG9801 isoform X1 [Diorhabda sublineata]XP_056648377.1 PP2C-like domain-containing protein CG9801 isoform X1 [Diorhabda sublineata]